MANVGTTFADGDAASTSASLNGVHDSSKSPAGALATGDVSDAIKTVLSKVTIRQLRRDEIPEACELIRSNWPTVPSLGFHYAMYDAYPGGWLCATIGDAIGGVIFFAKFPDGSGFGGYRIVKKEYRNAGVGGALREARLPYFSDSNLGINAVENVVDSNLRSGHSVVSFRLLSFCGEIDTTAAADQLSQILRQQRAPADAVTLSEVRRPSAELLRYDAEVNTVQREALITLYTALPESYTIVALRPDGSVVGYGTLHRGFEYYHVAPLYADDESVAELIFFTLVTRMLSGDKLFYTAPSQSAFAARLAERIALPVLYPTVRMYTRSEVVLPLHKVYAIASLEASFA